MTLAPTARARTTDPATSHAAAASVGDTTPLQANVLALFHHQGPMTDPDLLDLYRQMVDAGDYPPASPSGIRTRRNELEKAGRLVSHGEQRHHVTGRAHTVYGLPPNTRPTPSTSWSLVPRPRAATRGVLDEVLQEVFRSERKHGDQSHLPDGTGDDGWINEARDAKLATDEAAARGAVTWLDIMFEEVAEAFAEGDAALLRAELVQAAAVAVKWIEAIDRRTS